MHAVSGDHHHAGFLEDRRGGAAGRRIAGIDHEFDAVLTDQLVGGKNSLIWLGLIVIADELQLWPSTPPRGVDFVDRQLRGNHSRLSVGRRKAGERRLESDFDLGIRGHGGEERGGRQQATHGHAGPRQQFNIRCDIAVSQGEDRSSVVGSQRKRVCIQDLPGALDRGVGGCALGPIQPVAGPPRRVDAELGNHAVIFPADRSGPVRTPAQ